MHLNDDSDLIGELHEAMSSRAASIEVPLELTDAARRAARRRSVARAATVGVPVVAAAGVTTALVVGGGSSPAHLSIAPSHGATPQTGAASVTHARDTAYVTRRVRAALTSDRDAVFETTSSGGGMTGTTWFYADPRSGVQYQQDVESSAGGAPPATDVLVARPIDDVLHFRVTELDSVHHTYTVTDSVAAGPEKPLPAGTRLPPGFNSSSAQIAEALKSKQVIQQGTATIDGVPALTLSLPTLATDGQATDRVHPMSTAPGSVVGHGDSETATSTLYVDASSYQPLREVVTTSSPQTGSGTVTRTWLPATPANIALARPAIPSGYTQVPFTPTTATK